MSLGKQFCQAWAVFKIKSQEESSFASLVAEAQSQGKFFVVDFWTTKCVRCPAAMDRLNDEAEHMSEKAVFVSCALSQGDGNREIVSDLVDGTWENMTHTFMDMQQKEEVKAFFGFTQVPYCVVIDPAGVIVYAGDPKTMDLSVLFAVSAMDSENKVPVVQQQTIPSFVLDEDF